MGTTQKLKILTLVVGLSTIGTLGTAEAATIAGVTTPTTSGALDNVAFVTPAPNNNNAAGRTSPNILEFDLSFSGASGTLIDVLFDVDCTGQECTVAEYVVTQKVVNDWELPISGVSLTLGFGGADTGEVFRKSEGEDGLDFDEEGNPSPPPESILDTPIPSSTAFATCTTCTEGEFVRFKDGNLAPGANAVLEYQLDVPSLFLAPGGGFNIPDEFLREGGYVFTMRQEVTVVPIPAAAWLLASAITLGLFARRKKGDVAGMRP